MQIHTIYQNIVRPRAKVSNIPQAVLEELRKEYSMQCLTHPEFLNNALNNDLYGVYYINIDLIKGGGGGGVNLVGEKVLNEIFVSTWGPRGT